MEFILAICLSIRHVPIIRWFDEEAGSGCYRCHGGHRTHITPARYCSGGDEEPLEHDGHSVYIQEAVGVYGPPALLLLGTS